MSLSNVIANLKYNLDSFMNSDDLDKNSVSFTYQSQIAQANWANVFDIICMIIIAVYFSRGEADVWDIDASEYIVAYFVIITLLISYRVIVVVVPIIYLPINSLVFGFLLTLMYVGTVVFYVFFLVDFYSPRNNWKSVAQDLWIAMVVMAVEAFAFFLLVSLHSVNFVFMVIEHIKTLL